MNHSLYYKYIMDMFKYYVLQVKFQMAMINEVEMEENTDKFDITGRKINSGENIADTNENSLYIIDNKEDKTYSETKDNLDVNKERNNDNAKLNEEKDYEYLIDTDYEEEIQEEIKSVETQEIKKDNKYSVGKKAKHKKYKIYNDNKEENKSSTDSLVDDLSDECNYLPCPVQPPGLCKQKIKF